MPGGTRASGAPKTRQKHPRTPRLTRIYFQAVVPKARPLIYPVGGKRPKSIDRKRGVCKSIHQASSNKEKN